MSDNILLNIDTEKAYKINIGIDWGNTKKIGFIGKVFGFLRNKVDIDLSAYLYDINGAFLDSINANKLITCHGFIKHSGDDKSGDNKEDDTNNESITIINKNISSRVKAIIFIIDIRGSNLEIIPYLNLNIVTEDESGNVLSKRRIDLKSELGNDSVFAIAKFDKTLRLKIKPTDYDSLRYKNMHVFLSDYDWFVAYFLV